MWGGSCRAKADDRPAHMPAEWPPRKKPGRKGVRKETESVGVSEKAV